MINLTAQQCFDHACQTYERAKAIIADLTAATKEIAEKFNGEIAMRQFDFIAQAIMLNCGVQDGKFNELECVFVENLTEYGDLMVLINSEMKLQNSEWIDIKWTDIGQLKTENQDKLGVLAAEIVKKYAQDFTFFFSGIDYVDTGRDYYEELQECLFNMITFVSAVDEGGFDAEKGATEENIRGLTIMKYIFNDTWEENLEKFKAQLG